MKGYRRHIIWVMLITFSQLSYAGNKDRIGQSGAAELNIEGWTGNTALSGANMASQFGIRSMGLNVAGLGSLRGTEVGFGYTSWLASAGIGMNQMGFGQRFKNGGVMGLSIASFDFGDIPVTTVDQPEGGLGTFSPQNLIAGIAYAQEFSKSIYAGLMVKTISETVSNVSARGVAFDTGIRYVTGKDQRVKFGIALNNVGPKMKFQGDGLATKIELNEEEFTLEQRTEGFELPSSLSIGFSYDWWLVAKDSLASDTISVDSTGNSPAHYITINGRFTSHSFSQDQYHLGLDYHFRQWLSLKIGYVYEKGILNPWTRTFAYTGPSGGIELTQPLGKGNLALHLEYAYRSTHPFGGNHSVTMRISR